MLASLAWGDEGAVGYFGGEVGVFAVEDFAGYFAHFCFSVSWKREDELEMVRK